MTRDEILAMAPGRELDALMAEHIFEQPLECTLVGNGVDDPLRLEPLEGIWRIKSPVDSFWERWSPDGAERIINEFALKPWSTNVLFAFEVIEKTEPWPFSIHRAVNDWKVNWCQEEYSCELCADNCGCKEECEVSAETASEAICKALLLIKLEEGSQDV